MLAAAARGLPAFPEGDTVFDGVLFAVDAEAGGEGVDFCMRIGVRILAVLVI